MWRISLFNMPPSCAMTRRSQESSSIAQPPEFMWRFRAPLAILALQNHLLPNGYSWRFWIERYSHRISHGFQPGDNVQWITYCSHTWNRYTTVPKRLLLINYWRDYVEFYKRHNSLMFFWPCIMNWLYINYQLLCTDYYLFIKY